MLRELFSLAEDLQKANHRLDAAIEVRDVELLVRGVQVVVGQAHAHHDAGNLQILLELGDDGNRAAGADVHGVTAEYFVHGGDGGAGVGVVGGDHAGRALAVHLNAGRNPLRGDLGDVVGELLENVVGVLIGDEAHGNLGRTFGGNDGLGAGGDEASDDAVDFERGAGPGAVEHGVSGLAGEHVGADFGFAVLLFIKRKAGPGLEFVVSGLLYGIVEAGDEDVTVGVFQLTEDLDETEDRVRSGATVHAGVQIDLGAFGFDLGVEQAAQADAERGNVGRKQLGVGDQGEVGLQLLFAGVGLHVVLDAFAADFFFALDEHADVDGQLAVAGLKQGFEGLELHPELAFVVNGAAGVDVVVALSGFEGRGDPLVEGLGRLNVIVRIAERGGLAGGVQPVGVDKRVA